MAENVIENLNKNSVSGVLYWCDAVHTSYQLIPYGLNIIRLAAEHTPASSTELISLRIIPPLFHLSL
jgi:hypothetical protein